jgi:hypothetical protein
MTNISSQRFVQVIDEISNLAWTSISREELNGVAMAYYFFSIQFRENLELACELFPGDERLILLRDGECDTDNLSPYPGVAASGERMNHDEFMRRLIGFCELPDAERNRIAALGETYLKNVRQAEPLAKAQSISSYEDGGLERVFRAMLTAPDWRHAAMQAFHHFLVEHIRFDSDPDAGHGALSRHMVPDDRIFPLWAAFRDLLTGAVPQLSAAAKQSTRPVVRKPASLAV